MSSSPKSSPFLRYSKARLLTVFNPFFICSISILSLVAFCIWQYWLNPESPLISVEQEKPQPANNLLFPETTTENTTENNNSKEVLSHGSTNNTQASQSGTSPDNPNNNENEPSVKQSQEQGFDSILSQSNPTGSIFQPLVPQNNRINQGGGSRQGKLYEQLQNLPLLFPELLPTSTSSLAANPIDGESLPNTPLNQYQLRNSPAQSLYTYTANNYSLPNPTVQNNLPNATTSPLSQAVNRVSLNDNFSGAATRTSSNNNNNLTEQNQVTSNQTQAVPSGNVQGYTTYNNTPTIIPLTPPYSSAGYGGYGGYGATNPTNPYGGAANGLGFNPYNAAQVPAQGYNGTGVTQPGFPAYGF
jgi:hypothetical protein